MIFVSWIFFSFLVAAFSSLVLGQFICKASFQQWKAKRNAEAILLSSTFLASAWWVEVLTSYRVGGLDCFSIRIVGFCVIRLSNGLGV